MTKFTVHYEVDNYVYETDVNTATSYAAIYWVMALFPNAKNVYIVRGQNEEV